MQANISQKCRAMVSYGGAVHLSMELFLTDSYSDRKSVV